MDQLCEETLCPLFVNKVRTCEEICNNVTLLMDFWFCESGRHEECPYYKLIQNPEILCEYISQCNENHFAFSIPFEQMLQIANSFCLSPENKKKCARYKRYKQEKQVHDKLFPDGTILR